MHGDDPERCYEEGGGRRVHVWDPMYSCGGFMSMYGKSIQYYKREAVLMRWMKLEPITQSEVSQKEKYQYSILTHVYGI